MRNMYAIAGMCVFAVGCSDLKPEQYTTHSKVMESVVLPDGNRASVILTTVCDSNHACNRHVTSVKIN